MKRYIKIYSTKSNRLINIPIEIYKEMGLQDCKTVLIEYKDGVITIKKEEEK